MNEVGKVPFLSVLYLDIFENFQSSRTSGSFQASRTSGSTIEFRYVNR